MIQIIMKYRIPYKVLILGFFLYAFMPDISLHEFVNESDLINDGTDFFLPINGKKIAIEVAVITIRMPPITQTL